VVVDSLSAISAAFVGKEETYRIYIEQLFRLLENIGATSFLITESTDIPTKLTESGVEEFLADGVIIVYNVQRGNTRESAIEILKLRGASFQKKIVAMQIQGKKGIVVYPEHEVFGGIQ
jgi:KaiC/GvpD/RAD55 family RecA-like ATPase